MMKKEENVNCKYVSKQLISFNKNKEIGLTIKYEYLIKNKDMFYNYSEPKLLFMIRRLNDKIPPIVYEAHFVDIYKLNKDMTNIKLENKSGSLLFIKKDIKDNEEGFRLGIYNSLTDLTIDIFLDSDEFILLKDLISLVFNKYLDLIK